MTNEYVCIFEIFQIFTLFKVGLNFSGAYQSTCINLLYFEIRAKILNGPDFRRINSILKV